LQIIKPQMEHVEATGVSMARADDAAYFLETALRQRGYSNAAVDWRLLDTDNGGKRIHLIVEEGAGSRLGEIRFSGNEAVEGEAVMELLTSHTRKRVNAESGGILPYVPEDLDKGVSRIREFYQLLGYSEAEVSLKTGTPSGTVDVEVSVIEGNRYVVGAITIPEPPSSALQADFDKLHEDYSGKNYTSSVPVSLSSGITALARDAGYYDAEVFVEEVNKTEVATSGTVSVDLQVSAVWGETIPVSGIQVTGNEKVKSEFFTRHFEDLNGKPYSPNATNAEVEELLRTGAFESVRTDTVRRDDGSMALLIDVEEASMKEFGVYGGYATYEGPVAGFEFQNLNLNGMLRKVDAEIEASRRGLRGEISYEDPWFAWSDFRLQSSLFALNRINEGYSKFETGGRYEFSRKTGPAGRTQISIFGQATYTDIYETEIDPAELGDPSYFANVTGVSLSLDRTDNPRKPRSGFIAQSAVSVASSVIASEVEFLRATGRLGYYLPLGPATARLSARAGIISPMGDSMSLPIDLRFYNGGAQSVRSFDERELGPRDSRGSPVGGEFYSIFNFEIEMPFFSVDGLSVVPFFDAGNLLPDAGDAGLSQMRYALGLGLRYETPLGPLRVEYGYNPDRLPGEPVGAAHVGLGVAY
ncbi:MAG: BamA/TamA family outer membrane protein, partial [Verrucomicrobiales bacterium]|nr:BamA/TamA family outer membrane protein [Verrucomicrobiales bacterium]